MANDLLDHVYLNQEEQTQYLVGPGAPFLLNLAKVNIFIGPNNSGKSRFLRSLYAHDMTGCNMKVASGSGLPIDNLDRIASVYFGHVMGFIRTPTDATPAKAKIFSLPVRPDRRQFEKHLPWLSAAFAQISRNWEACPCMDNEQGKSNWEELHRKTLQDFRKAFTTVGQTGGFQKIYIPTLRGLRPPRTPERIETTKETTADYYGDRTVGDYKLPTGGSNIIFTGLTMYQDVKQHLLGLREERQLIHDYEDFLSNSFFNGDQISLTPGRDGDVLLVNVGHEERRIHDLGDGIQQMIMLTFPVFMQRGKPILLFVEEPELYLHPGLQRQLLEKLTSNDDVFGSTQVFMSTHSNHFLDMTLDMDQISVYRFTKDTQGAGDETAEIRFHIENTSNTDHNLLMDLGVRNSSVFLTNCTIWVEGITDRMYLRKFLALYQEQLPEHAARFMEDVHYSIAEYGGSNIVHWAFELDTDTETQECGEIRVDRLCGKAFVIADKDSRKEKKHERLREELKDRYHVLGCREIENSLSPEILLATFKSFEGLERVALSKPRSQDSYRDEPLGTYIDKQVLPEGAPRTFAAASGTIRDKVGFARKACAAMSSWDQLTEDARILAKEVYEFIRKENPAPS